MSLKGWGHGGTSRRIVCVALLVAVAVCAAGITDGRSAPSSGLALDVELAFDGTGSMGPLIAQAQTDAQAIVDAVRGLDPAARFSVVTFRDPGYPAPEYKILQPFTANVAAVKRALGRVRSVETDSPANVRSEAYNLAFQRSVDDERLGWRPASRKVVVVFGDAEPHGAGIAGLPGCRDQNPDTHGLNTADVVARMRESGRTLLMVRGPSNEASLNCYRSIAALAAPGSAARDAGSADLAAPILNLLESALLTTDGTAGFPLALPNTKRVVSFTLKNASGGPVRLKRVSLRLPSGMRLAGWRGLSTPTVVGQTVVWDAGIDLAPGRVLRIIPRLNVGSRIGTGVIALTTETSFPDERVVKTRTPVRLRVGRSVALRVIGVGTSSPTSGIARLTYAPNVRLLAGPTRANGKLVIGSGTSVATYSIRSARVLSTGAPTQFALSGTVVSARRPSCPAGVKATVTLVDRDVVSASTTPDVIKANAPGCSRTANGDVLTR